MERELNFAFSLVLLQTPGFPLLLFLGIASPQTDSGDHFNVQQERGGSPISLIEMLLLADISVCETCRLQLLVRSGTAG